MLRRIRKSLFINDLNSIDRTDRRDSILRLDPGAQQPYLSIMRPIVPFLQSAQGPRDLRRISTNMLIRSSFPNLRSSFQAPDATSAEPARAASPRPTLVQRLDRWFWRQEQKSRERYLARVVDRFDFERRLRHIDRAGTFGFD